MSDIRNLTCLLPDGCIGVKLWARHPCGGLYVRDAYCYGPNGRIGRWMDDVETVIPSLPVACHDRSRNEANWKL